MAAVVVRKGHAKESLSSRQQERIHSDIHREWHQFESYPD